MAYLKLFSIIPLCQQFSFHSNYNKLTISKESKINFEDLFKNILNYSLQILVAVGNVPPGLQRCGPIDRWRSDLQWNANAYRQQFWVCRECGSRFFTQVLFGAVFVFTTLRSSDLRYDSSMYIFNELFDINQLYRWLWLDLDLQTAWSSSHLAKTQTKVKTMDVGIFLNKIFFLFKAYMLKSSEVFVIYLSFLVSLRMKYVLYSKCI